MDALGAIDDKILKRKVMDKVHKNIPLVVSDDELVRLNLEQVDSVY